MLGPAGSPYPTFTSVPKTSFSCDQFGPGYYADLETDCQVGHTDCQVGHTVGQVGHTVCQVGHTQWAQEKYIPFKRVI